MRLIEGSLALKDAYRDYITEWVESGEKIVPMAASGTDLTYDALLERWAFFKSDRAYEKGFVPSTTYFFVDDDGIILGALDFRHTLNEHLKISGGHFGYGVRPSARGKGLAYQMVLLALEYAREMGLDKVLITCNDDNIGSYKTIERAGGLLENKTVHDGFLTRRYWITLKDIN